MTARYLTLVSVVSALLLFSDRAIADPTSKVGNEALACIDQSFPKKIAQIQKEVDPAAEEKAMALAKASRGCTILKKGADIFLEDSGYGGVLTLVRPKGEVDSYWMQADRIDVN